MKITEKRLTYLLENTYSGYCLHCDDITTEHGVEPDAQEYECPNCGNHTMMGLENALIIGKLTFAGNYRKRGAEKEPSN